METFWNGERCEARRVTVTVAEWDPDRDPPLAWWRELSGQTRNAVEVIYAGRDPFYLDDDGHVIDWTPEQIEIHKVSQPGAERPLEIPAGQGWAKVTFGKGSPQYGHSEYRVAEGSVELRLDVPPDGSMSELLVANDPETALRDALRDMLPSFLKIGGVRADMMHGRVKVNPRDEIELDLLGLLKELARRESDGVFGFADLGAAKGDDAPSDRFVLLAGLDEWHRDSGGSSSRVTVLESLAENWFRA